MNFPRQSRLGLAGVSDTSKNREINPRCFQSLIVLGMLGPTGECRIGSDMKPQGFHMTERVAREVDPEMTLSDIAKILSRMDEHYPTETTRKLAQELAIELGEVYLDKMCQHLIQAPFWNSRDSRGDE